MSKSILTYISDHELNKDTPDAIVYRDVNGVITRLTEKDFASREEFEKWKAWSDTDYAEIEKSDRQYNDHKVPLFDQDSPTVSTEEYFFGVSERIGQESQQESILVAFLQTLTPVQARRFCLYYGEGMTLEEIAEIEGVGFQRVAESLELCKKKISKFNCKYSVKTGGKISNFSVLSERGKKQLRNLEKLIGNVKGTKPV